MYTASDLYDIYNTGTECLLLSVTPASGGSDELMCSTANLHVVNSPVYPINSAYWYGWLLLGVHLQKGFAAS